MIVAFVGVCVMIINDSISGTALGAIIGFISATGFALYTVTIRWKPETPKFTTVVLAGIFCHPFFRPKWGIIDLCQPRVLSILIYM